MRARFLPGLVNRHHVGAIELSPVVRLEDVDRERIDFAGRAADPVAVILDHEKDRKLPLLGETDRFKKIALPGGGVADRGDDEVRFAIELDPPGDPAAGQKLRAGRRRHAPDVALGVAVMRRHLPAVALTFALREIIQRQLRGGDPASEHERAVAIITADIIARVAREGERGERFVAHPGNVKVPLALAIEILFAQIAVAALEQDGEKAKFVFVAQGHWKLRVGR